MNHQALSLSQWGGYPLGVMGMGWGDLGIGRISLPHFLLPPCYVRIGVCGAARSWFSS